MNLKRIEGHTVDLSIVDRKTVVDLGCRDFKFSEYFKNIGCAVLAFDADKEVFKNPPKGIVCFNNAVTTYNGRVNYYKLGECGYTDDIKEHNPDESEPVDCISYSGIINEGYDILKMDVEGAEYAILSDPDFKPYPKQITVEFHEHCFKELHDKMYQKCLDNLSRWYDLVYTMEDNEFKLIDTLFIRKF